MTLDRLSGIYIAREGIHFGGGIKAGVLQVDRVKNPSCRKLGNGSNPGVRSREFVIGLVAFTRRVGTIILAADIELSLRIFFPGNWIWRDRIFSDTSSIIHGAADVSR